MEQLVRDAQQLFNVHLTGRQVMALINYERELLDWNRKFNLTAIRDKEAIRTKHFLDSFSCVLAWKANPPQHLVDVGTGAGFPGIPLKILYPNMKLTLVESVGKKAMFCHHIVRVLGLEGGGPAEAQSAETAMKLLGGKLKQLIPVHLPGVADDRYIVVVNKVAATPPQYPRKAGMPAKQPL